jgi:hypothetical protein
MERYGKTEQARRDSWIEIHLDGGLWNDRAEMERLHDRNTSRWRDTDRQSSPGETAR